MRTMKTKRLALAYLAAALARLVESCKTSQQPPPLPPIKGGRHSCWATMHIACILCQVSDMSDSELERAKLQALNQPFQLADPRHPPPFAGTTVPLPSAVGGRQGHYSRLTRRYIMLTLLPAAVNERS